MATPSHVSTRDQLEDLLSRRILVLDGAMGSMIFAHQPAEADYRGARFHNHPVALKNCTEVMALTQPKMIEDIHRAYLEAGADIVSTDTFNSNAISMGEFQLVEHVVELNRAAATLARRAADDYTRRTPGQAALRGRQHRADQQEPVARRPCRRPRPPRRDLRPDGRRLHRAGPHPGRGRRGHPPAGNLVRHAGDEGVPVRHRAGL